MRVLMSGGGTAGHVNPALEIAAKIKKENPDAVIEYVGTERGLETKLVPEKGIPLHFVHVEGIKRKLTPSNIKAVVHAVTSVFEAKKLIRSFLPDIVIGTGGYVCWPVLKAASSMGIPTLVHESNAIPGLTTRMVSGRVDRVLLNFRESAKYLDVGEEKTLFVGNPVKSEMFELTAEECRKKLGIPDEQKMVLSFGGSLGARRFNQTVFEMITYGLVPPDCLLIHATGAGYWDNAKLTFLEKGFQEISDGVIKKGNTEIRRYIYNMPELMASSNIVICRAGAMTVSEIAAMGKTAIFIPSPNVTDNQQYRNASVLKRAGAAELIEEKDLSAKGLSELMCSYLYDKNKSLEISEKVKAFAEPACLDKIYSEIVRLTQK